MQSSPVMSISPSFNSYSSSRLAEIAARVVEEFRAEADDHGGGAGFDYGSNLFLTDYEESLRENGNETHFHDRLTGEVIHDEINSGKNGDGEEKENDKEDAEEEEEEFEFAVVGRDFVWSLAPADEIFYNGQIRPCFPLFNQEVEKEEVNMSGEKARPPQPPMTESRRLSLRKLFIEDRELPSSCSSSEADELDGVQPGSYCVWNPKMAAGEGRGKKSNSTGSSKRWRIRDFLHRSNSEGKSRFVFLTQSDSRNAKKTEENKVDKKIEKSSAAVAPEVPKAASAAESKVEPAESKVAPAAGYPKNDGDRRRMSFLPYRQDLVGFFSNVNGLSRNLHPF